MDRRIEWLLPSFAVITSSTEILWSDFPEASVIFNSSDIAVQQRLSLESVIVCSMKYLAKDKGHPDVGDVAWKILLFLYSPSCISQNNRKAMKFDFSNAWLVFLSDDWSIVTAKTHLEFINRSR